MLNAHVLALGKESGPVKLRCEKDTMAHETFSVRISRFLSESNFRNMIYNC